MQDRISLLMLDRRVCLLSLPSPKNNYRSFFSNDGKKFDDISGQIVVAKMIAYILELKATPQEQDFRICCCKDDCGYIRARSSKYKVFIFVVVKMTADILELEAASTRFSY
ncbi:hypothetical protein Tco_0820178 [Tanacetum coccineum]|uniref:Uncharacterized protein n=1 Tax=Tanacetum coccineum TaxID=301880 RepID=A0ABQ5ACX5_9ASTR